VLDFGNSTASTLNATNFLIDSGIINVHNVSNVAEGCSCEAAAPARGGDRGSAAWLMIALLALVRTVRRRRLSVSDRRGAA